MSGLIEQIVRRRRASAGRRLGPPGQIPGAYGAGVPNPNGRPPAPFGHATPEPVADAPPAPSDRAVGRTPPAVEAAFEPPANGSAPLDVPLGVPVDVPVRDRGERIVWSPRRPAPELKPPAPPEPEVEPEPEPEPEVVTASAWSAPAPDEPEPERKYVPLQSFDAAVEDFRAEPEPDPAIPWTPEPAPAPEGNQSWTYAPAPVEPQPTATPEPEPGTDPEPEQLDGSSEKPRRLARWPRALRPEPTGAMPEWVTEVAPEPPADVPVDPVPEPQPFISDAVPQAEAAPQFETAAETDTAPETDTGSEPGFGERGSIRRRARFLRALREVQLRDIGGFVVELHRFGRERPDLVLAKVEGAQRTDIEIRALQSMLGETSSIRELREAGIGGACGNCGAVHGSEDRYCASCGEPLQAERYAPDDAAEPGADGSQ